MPCNFSALSSRLIFLILCLGRLALLDAADCSAHWKELALEKKVLQSFDFNKPVYTPEDKAKIEKIWNSSASSKDKADQIFEVYKEARLRTVPPDVRKFVEKVLAKSANPPPESLADYFQTLNRAAFYDPNKRMIKTTHFNSGAEVFIAFMKAHEMEHAIQHGLALQYADENLYAKWGRTSHKDFVKNLFMSEASAMAAEAEFLHGLPDAEEYLRDLMKRAGWWNMTPEEYLKKVKTIGFEDPNFKAQNMSVLALAALSLHQSKDIKGYLATQWGRSGAPIDPHYGRYNVKQIRQYREIHLAEDLLKDRADKREAIFTKLLKAVGGLTLGLVGYTWGCVWLRENHPDIVDNYCFGPFGNSSKTAAELEKEVPSSPTEEEPKTEK